MKLSEATVHTALSQVFDPEFPVSIVDLGLVYGCTVRGSRVTVQLTYTSCACPCKDWIEADITSRLHNCGFTAVHIEVVWSPPWTPQRLSTRALAILRQYGIAGE